MSALRDLARRLAPSRAREAVRRFKKAMQGPPLFSVELGDYRFVPDPSPAPRLTLVLPSVSRRSAFGGVTTGLDIFVRLARRAREGEGDSPDLRVATTSPEAPERDNALTRAAAAAGLDPNAIEILPWRFRGAEMPTRAGEVFFAFNWHCAANLKAVLRAQAAHFAVSPRPLIYLIQEYEPGFFPFSADRLLISEAYGDDWPIHAVINSSLLAEYIAMQGHRFAKTHVFEPRLTDALRPFLAGAGGAERARRILVYGRPMENRNCFPILERGLRIWAEKHPEQAGWEVVSAGAPHRPIALAGGRRAASVGKLSLEDYARLLSTSAVGVALMASPHPSYPPLEMAHFGMRTITNRYANKDLSRLHDNIVSLESARPEVLAETLARVCAAFEADPGAGARAASRMPGYLAQGPYPFEAELAADIAAAQGR